MKWRDDVERRRAFFKKYYHEHKETIAVTSKKSRLKKLYGLTLDDLARMLEGQDGKCLICGRRLGDIKRTYVDHDHATGAIRGLLCLHCNTGLGNFQDSPDILRKAAEYLYNPKEVK